MKSVSELRRSGYKVRVTHVRLTRNPAIINGNADNLLSRYEHNLAKSEGKLTNSLSFGESVFPNGGFTVVEVSTPEGRTFKGKYNFGKRRFERKIGVVAALGRAYKQN